MLCEKMEEKLPQLKADLRAWLFKMWQCCHITMRDCTGSESNPFGEKASLLMKDDENHNLKGVICLLWFVLIISWHLFTSQEMISSPFCYDEVINTSFFLWITTCFISKEKLCFLLTALNWYPTCEYVLYKFYIC